jgi:tetrahydromethanopterin S-methyltransferase subunit F
LESAVQAEEYGEADGLKQRVEMLRSQHPLIPREERIEEALNAGVTSSLLSSRRIWML